MIVFAVADFLGTTFGLDGVGPFLLEDFLFAGAKSVSDSSSEIGRGGALLLVTNPDFFVQFFFLIFSVSWRLFFLRLFEGLGFGINFYYMELLKRNKTSSSLSNSSLNKTY